ncbi:phage integrase family protein [Isorropodon fossajaponicum endosymbiont JTNG4]|uniref:tyrosine-type recombinase/integrase n=1 Tax=Isorropodon fossajaponicum symbiont TaxID=883811 RepID=UPI0019164ADF|nr:integrase family protein [Isorropodon fossajaponicum symbiont]BBB23864.1 phage integrase family protein [Isorropodon fossajaponicum endosymbiont JTNG4]
MDRFNFTKKRLDDLPNSSQGRRDMYYDSKVIGLSLRVTARGVKSFFVRKRVDGKYVQKKLGQYPDITIDLVRSSAMKALSQFSAGIDPNKEARDKKIKSITLLETMNDYAHNKKNLIKEKTIRDYQTLFNSYLSEWQNLELSSINRPMVEKKHRSIGKKSIYRANATMRLLRALFNFAIGEYEDSNGIPTIGHNPVQKISHKKAWFREKVRRNIVEPNDLKVWFEAVLNLPYNKANVTNKNTSETVRDYILILLFTGLRPGEAINLTWNNIDFNNNLLNIKDTKNHEDHTLPLTSFIIDILKRRKSETLGLAVLPGYNPNKPLVNPNKQVKKVIEDSGIQFLLHDLRRTFATYADSLNIQHSTIKRLMNHKETDVTSVHYIQPSIETLRKPMQKITDYILETANVN